MRQYTTIAQIEDYLLTEIAPAFEHRVLSWIEQVSRYIEQETGRVFIASASVKKYDGNSKDELFIDEIASLVSIKINGMFISSGDILLYPANETPKTRIKLRNGIFNKGEQNIEITANWGYSISCPLDITLATTIMVAGIINFAGELQDNVKTERLADYSITYNDPEWKELEKAKQIIQSYTKISI